MSYHFTTELSPPLPGLATLRERHLNEAARLDREATALEARAEQISGIRRDSVTETEWAGICMELHCAKANARHLRRCHISYQLSAAAAYTDYRPESERNDALQRGLARLADQVEGRPLTPEQVRFFAHHGHLPKSAAA